MAHIFDGDISKLESEERKKVLPADEILARLNITQGSTVIDFGCGPGYFTLPVLNLVGDNGKVIAIDISDKMLDILKVRCKNHSNIEIVKSDSIKGFNSDLILLIHVLHEVDNTQDFLNFCFEALNPGGRLVIIDWQKIETKMGPPLSHRISKEDIIKMTDRPFTEYDIDDSMYFLVFEGT